MKVNPINTTYIPVNFHNPKNQKSSPAFSKTQAVKKGISTAGGWFGFGIVLDILSRHIRFSKSPTKNSFALNGLIGTCAGVVSGMSFLIDRNRV